MRLNINGEEIAMTSDHSMVKVIKDTTDLLWKEYADENNRIILEWTKNNLSFAMNEKNRRIVQRPTQKSLSLTKEYISSRTISMGSVEVSLYKTKKTHPANPSVSILMPRRYKFNGRLILTPKDRELAFYLVFVSSHCAKLDHPSLADYQSKRSSDPWYHVYNEARSAKRSIDSIQQKARVTYLIASKEDNYKLDPDELNALAYIFGMKSPEKSTDDGIRKYLLDRIENDRTNTFIEKLDEMVNSKDKIKVNAMFYRAKSLGLVDVRKVKNKKAWAYKDAQGNFTEDIMSCSSGVNEDMQLIAYLLNNVNALDKLKFEIEARTNM